MDLSFAEIESLKDYAFHLHGKPAKPPKRIAGISIDSRKISPQELYIAIRGEQHDGHKFVEEALAKKAGAVVVERNWWQTHAEMVTGKPVFVVENTVLALQQLANYYRKKFSISVVGLTGTNGKTTTKEMVAAVLSKLGNVCKTQGNLNNHIGVPLTLFDLDASHNYAIVEMGANHFGEIATLCKIAEPDYGLITNIGHGHLEFFKSLEGVARAKMELFDYLADKGTVFVNIDDPLIAKYAPRIDARIDYGFRQEALVSGEALPPAANGNVRMRLQCETLTLPLAGEHNLSNALAATAVGLHLGLDLKKIKAALTEMQVPSKRLRIYEQGDYLIIDDSYNANPDSTLAALNLLKQTQTAGKKFFIFGDMLELGQLAPAEHAKIGGVLADYDVNVVLAFGPQSQETVRAARQASPKITAAHFVDKDELIKALKDQLQHRDVVLIKGSRGMRMEEVIEKLG